MLVGLFALFSFGCGDGRAPDGPHPVRVYCAASLEPVLAPLLAAHTAAGGPSVVIASGSTGTLAGQVRDGAPPGVLLAASEEWADRLEAWGRVETGTRVDLLSNALVVVVPRGASWRPADLPGLATPELRHLALADPDAAPAGTFAREALRRAGAWNAMEGRIVAAPDVRSALHLVETGEVEAGIVYATDAAASVRVEVAFKVPPTLHAPIRCPLLLIRNAPPNARKVWNHLQSAEARQAFQAAGFGE